MCDALSLDGKLALVTGGTRGVGRAISLHLARAGASVIANHVRDVESAAELEAQAAGENLSLSLCRADITTKKGLEKVERDVRNAGGALDALVHCAATGVHRRFEELTARHWDWTFSLNARAFFTLTKLLTPTLAKGASIVAVSSRGAVRAEPYYSVIGASKGALESLARHMAAELAPEGIRVNVLSPGSVQTHSWDVMPDGEQRLAETVSRTPMGRLVSLDEVASAALFLCSEASAGIVGQTIVVDGGSSIIA